MKFVNEKSMLVTVVKEKIMSLKFINYKIMFIKNNIYERNNNVTEI